MDHECDPALTILRLMRLALLVGLVGCLSGGGRSATPSDRSMEPKPMISTDESHNFTFTFRSLSDMVSPGIYTYMTVTRVDGPSSRALMILNRHGGDMINRPVGLFATTLSSSGSAALAAAIDGIGWSALPVPVKGDVSAAGLELDYTHGQLAIKRSFSASNMELLHALAPMMGQLDQLDGTLLAHPDRAISVGVARTNQGFKLILRNVGVGPVIVADPRLPSRSPSGSGAATRGTIGVARVAEKTGGFQPLPTLITVPLQPHSGPASIVLAPGQTLEVETIPWSSPGAGKYLAKASWIDYAGPDVDPTSIMPMIPDPSTEPGDHRPYAIRGATFSGYLQF